MNLDLIVTRQIIEPIYPQLLVFHRIRTHYKQLKESNFN